jgi:hypothetical protein
VLVENRHALVPDMFAAITESDHTLCGYRHDTTETWPPITKTSCMQQPVEPGHRGSGGTKERANCLTVTKGAQIVTLKEGVR